MHRHGIRLVLHHRVPLWSLLLTLTVGPFPTLIQAAAPEGATATDHQGQRARYQGEPAPSSLKNPGNLGFEEILFVKRKPFSSDHYYTDIDNGTSPDRRGRSEPWSPPPICPAAKA